MAVEPLFGDSENQNYVGGKTAAPPRTKAVGNEWRLVVNDDIGGVVTIQEIESQFDGEWVLVEDPQTNDLLEVVSGNVVHHSKDRDEVYRTAVALKPKRCAVLYTGEIPDNTAVLL